MESNKPYISSIFISLVVALFGIKAVALPQGQSVSAGDVTFTQNGNQLDIHQNTDKAIVNYSDFDIAKGETVNFNQPGARAVILNRVLGDSASDIFGTMNANGKVFLVNPNGVYFAPGAQVDVGALAVSTLPITDADFLNDKLEFQDENNSSGAIHNSGSLHGKDYIVLLAPLIHNSGDIDANQVSLLAGDKVILVPSDGEGIGFEVESSTATTLIENNGLIQGNELSLWASSAEGVWDAVINNEGNIEASGVVQRNGEIHLVSEGDLFNEGVVSADGDSSFQQAGKINLEANRIAQLGEISADSREFQNGGEIYLTAEDTIFIAEGSVMSADADKQGDGGIVRAYSSQKAVFGKGASISARGGEELGDGGFVEVSGMDYVAVGGSVDTRAANGNNGLFLIDPTNIEIIAGTAAVNGAFAPIVGGEEWVPDTLGASQIGADDINTLLSTGNNVTVDTARANTAGNTGTLVVNADIDLDGGNGQTLTLQSDDTMDINANICEGGAVCSSVDDSVSVLLISGGNLNINAGAEIDTGGGLLTTTVGGNTDINATAKLSSSDGNMIIASGGNLVVNDGAVITAGSGKVGLSGGSVQITGVNSTNTDVDAVTVNSLTFIRGGAGTDVTVDSGGLILSATAGITGAGGAGNLDVLASSIDLTNTAGNASISDATGATYLDINSAGDFAHTSSAGDVVISGVTSLGGNFTVTAGNDLTINNGVLVDVGGNQINLTATGGDATVTGLRTTSAAANAIRVNAGNRILDGGAANIDIQAVNGGAILKSVNGIYQSVSNGGIGDNSGSALNVNVDRLDVENTGSGNVLLTTQNNLTLTDLDADTDSVNVQDGNFALWMESGSNLTIEDDVLARDNTANGTRAGNIHIDLDGGNLNFGSTAAATISSMNTVDQGAASILGATPSNEVSILIRQTDATDSSTNWVFGDNAGVGDTRILAEGGDIYIDTIGGATLTGGNNRDLTLNSDVEIISQNNAGDPISGNTIVASVVDNGVTLRARAGRFIQINQGALAATSFSSEPPDENGEPPLIEDILSNVNEDPDPDLANVDGDESDKEGTADIDLAMDSYFAQCHSQIDKGSNQDSDHDTHHDSKAKQDDLCQREKSLRQFLSKLFIGGRIPDVQ